jgi:hypothetical protein
VEQNSFHAAFTDDADSICNMQYLLEAPISLWGTPKERTHVHRPCQDAYEHNAAAQQGHADGSSFLTHVHTAVT